MKSHVAWFYTPMAMPLLRTISPEVIVYDCMDELSQFRFAPPEIIERERGLLQRADVVFEEEDSASSASSAFDVCPLKPMNEAERLVADYAGTGLTTGRQRCRNRAVAARRHQMRNLPAGTEEHRGS